uniref:Dihydroflavonol 4-reductase n=1 Tax=Angelonia angustifolia TaxID=258236 RepID=A0A088C8A2_9LAMI|nr:dihydroflavonol 4-reductase [Angelonia angustifolia]
METTATQPPPPSSAAAVPATVCVTGAAGFIGSWLVMKLLQRGYNVRATVRDPGNLKKIKHLTQLPKADTNLTLWKADLMEEASFDEAIEGCQGVFHLATPMEFDSKDPENEVIKPTIEGMMSIIRSCAKAKTVEKVIFTTSAGTLNVEEHQKPFYDETSWSDLDFIYSKKMTGWMYFVSKYLAEKQAVEAAKLNNIEFISIIPPVVVGPFINPAFPPSLVTALSPITGNEAHYTIMKQGQFVHLDDICEAHIFLFEHPKADGRYICSSHDATIYDIARLIRDKWPEYNVPMEFKGIDKDIPVVRFSSKKLTSMGFKFKYSLEDMYRGAIETCREKGLLPYSTHNQSNGEKKESTLQSLEKHSDDQEKVLEKRVNGRLDKQFEEQKKELLPIREEKHTNGSLEKCSDDQAKVLLPLPEEKQTNGSLEKHVMINIKTCE